MNLLSRMVFTPPSTSIVHTPAVSPTEQRNVCIKARYWSLFGLLIMHRGCFCWHMQPLSAWNLSNRIRSATESRRVCFNFRCSVICFNHGCSVKYLWIGILYLLFLMYHFYILDLCFIVIPRFLLYTIIEPWSVCAFTGGKLAGNYLFYVFSLQDVPCFP